MVKEIIVDPEKLKKDYESGKTSVEIAKEYGCGEQTILNKLKKYSIPKRRNHPRYRQSIKIPDKKIIIYVAGIVDGEGSIGYFRCKNNYNERGVNLFITNTDKNLMNFLKENIGGTVKIHQKIGKSHDEFVSRKICYRWHIEKIADVFLLCKALYPFLIIKKTKAKEVIDYCKQRLDGQGALLRRKKETNMEKKV